MGCANSPSTYDIYPEYEGGQNHIDDDEENEEKFQDFEEIGSN